MTKGKTKPTYVLAETHKKVKGFAGFKGIDLLEAYELLVVEGLKALDFELPKS